MIAGWFGEMSGRAYIEGRVLIPRLRWSGAVTWVVDTGADQSMLGPEDALRIGVDPGRLIEGAPSFGVGGSLATYAEPALLLFVELPFIQVNRIVLDIAPLDSKPVELPSPLGRDVLDRWRMDYHPTANQLLFEVISADVSRPFP